MTVIRPSAVAGTFYPAEREALTQTITALLRRALQERQAAPAPGPIPKALIAPHAGYIYSGSTAARGYVELAPIRDQIDKVVLLGPAHRVAINGLATTSADYWQSPFGPVPIDPIARAMTSKFPYVTVNDQAHAREHSLEVHLPFLQKLIPTFTLLPFVVGRASGEEVSAVLDALWGGDETLILISSDLSHFLTYDEARKIDSATALAIEAMDETQIGRDQACGRVPIFGLLNSARNRGLRVHRLALCNSGDTAGDKDRVVGYGTWSLSTTRPNISG